MMKILICCVVLVLVVSTNVQARRWPPRDRPFGEGCPPGGGHPDGHRPYRGPFQSCWSYEEAVHDKMHEMIRNGEAGPENCESNNPNECRENFILQAVNRTETRPSPECQEKMAQAYYITDCEQ